MQVKLHAQKIVDSYKLLKGKCCEVNHLFVRNNMILILDININILPHLCTKNIFIIVLYNIKHIVAINKLYKETKIVKDSKLVKVIINNLY